MRHDGLLVGHCHDAAGEGRGAESGQHVGYCAAFDVVEGPGLVESKRDVVVHGERDGVRYVDAGEVEVFALVVVAVDAVG